MYLFSMGANFLYTNKVCGSCVFIYRNVYETRVKSLVG